MFYLVDKVKRYLVYSKLWVALALVAEANITQTLWQQKNNAVLVLLFFLGLIAYNLNHLKNHYNTTVNKYLKNKHLILLSIAILGASVSIPFLWKQPWTWWLCLGMVFLISVFYLIPIIPYKKRYLSLRAIPTMKIFLIALCWTSCSSILAIPIKNISFIYVLSSFLFHLAITLPFDIQDIHTDPKKLKSIPMLLGIPKTKILCYTLLVLCASLLCLFIKNHKPYIKPYPLYVTLAIFALLAVLIYFSSPLRNKNYFYLLLEGVPIYWAILIILGKMHIFA